MKISVFLTAAQFLKLSVKSRPVFKAHGIDKVRLKQWINLHPTQWRSLATDFTTTFRYVTWHTWLTRFHALLTHYVKTKRGNWLPLKVDKESVICKSNFWVTQIAIEFVQQRFRKNNTSFKGVICSQDSKEISEIINRRYLNDLLLIDDATYSGGQIADLVHNLTSDVVDHLKLAIPYVSMEAKSLITENAEKLDLFVDDPYDPIVSVIETWQVAGDFSPEEIELIELHILPDNSPQWTTYFQFKMPDWVSIVDAIRTGLVKTGPKSSAWLKFIRNCHADVHCPAGIYKFSTPLCRRFALEELRPKILKFQQIKQKELEEEKKRKDHHLLIHQFQTDVAFAVLQREEDSLPPFKKEEALDLLKNILSKYDTEVEKRLQFFKDIEPILDLHHLAILKVFRQAIIPLSDLLWAYRLLTETRKDVAEEKSFRKDRARKK